MDFELLQTSDLAFRIIVLAAITAAYVAFELLAGGSRRRKQNAG